MNTKEFSEKVRTHIEALIDFRKKENEYRRNPDNKEIKTSYESAKDAHETAKKKMEDARGEFLKPKNK